MVSIPDGERVHGVPYLSLKTVGSHLRNTNVDGNNRKGVMEIDRCGDDFIRTGEVGKQSCCEARKVAKQAKAAGDVLMPL